MGAGAWNFKYIGDRLETKAEVKFNSRDPAVAPKVVYLAAAKVNDSEVNKLIAYPFALVGAESCHTAQLIGLTRKILVAVGMKCGDAH